MGVERTTIAEQKSAPSRVRRGAFFAVVILFALMHFFLSPLPQVVLGWFLEEGPVSHRVHEVCFGLAFVLSLVGLLAQLRQPETKIAQMYQVVIVIEVLVVLSLVVDRLFDPVILAFGILPVVLVLLHPARDQLFHPTHKLATQLGIMVLLAAVPLAVFAFTQIQTGIETSRIARAVFERLPEEASQSEVDDALRQATPSNAAFESARHFGHWTAMGGYAIIIIALGTVAAFRPLGWTFPAWGAGAALIYYGVVSFAATGDASSAPPMWATAAILWGGAFITLAMLTPSPERDPAGRLAVGPASASNLP
jgi:hypothetical protein